MSAEYSAESRLVLHFLATLAYRTQRALRDAPSGFGDFDAGAGVRNWLRAEGNWSHSQLVRRRRPDVDLHVVHGLPPECVPLHMNACDLLLLTSVHEGSPMVVKEALACNLPVVAVPAGDVATRLQDVAGCHVVDAEPEALASAVERVLAAPPAVAGRAAVASLSAESVARSLRELYARVTGLP